MQIKLDMKLVFFLLVFYITHQIRIYVILMIFACFHELGHLIIGIILGIKPISIEIKPIGLSMSLKNPITDYNKKILNGNILELKKIFIYIMGPVVNILIAVTTYLFYGNTIRAQELIYINLIIAFVNFLPIYPLDGGRILKSTFHLAWGLKKAYELTEKVSLAVTIFTLAIGSIVVLKVHNFGLLIMLMYLVFINISENKKIESRIKLYKLIDKEQ